MIAFIITRLDLALKHRLKTLFNRSIEVFNKIQPRNIYYIYRRIQETSILLMYFHVLSHLKVKRPIIGRKLHCLISKDVFCKHFRIFFFGAPL